MQATKNNTRRISFGGKNIFSNNISCVYATVVFALWQRQLSRHTITSATYDTYILHIVFHGIYNYWHYFIKYDACASI